MTNSAWQATIQNESGDIVPTAEITVIDEGTGLNATIFSTRGGAALTNPFTADSNGFAQFYASFGEYRIEAVEASQGIAETWRYVRLGDGGSIDTGTAFDQIPLNTDIVYPVDTLADLRLLTGLVDGQVFYLRGYSVFGVGNGEVVVLGDQTTETDNGGWRFVIDGKVLERNLNESFLTPEMFGWHVGLSTADSNTVIQNALSNSNTLHFGPNEYPYNQLSISINRQLISMSPRGWLRAMDDTADHTITISEESIVLNDVHILGTTPNVTSKIRVTGFTCELFRCLVTGSHGNGVIVDEKELRIIRGFYRGATFSGIRINVPDTVLDNVYSENNGTGVSAFAGFNGNGVHCVGNSVNSFFLSGASHSQLNSCYSDTPGSTGWNVRDSGGGITFTDCWGFNSGFSVNDSVDFQFFNCRNIVMTGCRSNGVHANATGSKQGSIRFSGDTNIVSLFGCWTEQDVVGLPGSSDTINAAPIQFIGCTGQIQKYSRPAETFISSTGAIVALGTKDLTFRIRTDETPLEPGITSYDIITTTRTLSGSNLIGVQKFRFIRGHALGFPANAVTLVDTTGSALIDVDYVSYASDPTSDTFAEIADLTLRFTNLSSTASVQAGAEIQIITTTRGYS